MNRREAIVVECARHVVGAVARQLDSETSDHVAWELEASLKALALAVRALDRAEPATIPEALEAGTPLPEAFERATGRPLDLLGKRRLRDEDFGDSCRCPDHRY